MSGSVKTVGAYAFNGCGSLRGVSLLSCGSVGERAFAYSGLTEIELPSGMSVGNYAFAWSRGLKTVRLANVSSIGDYAFRYCTSLTDVYFGGTKEEWKQFEARKYWIFYDIKYPQIHIGEEGLSLLSEEEPTVTDNDPLPEDKEEKPGESTVTDNAPKTGEEKPEEKKEPKTIRCRRGRRSRRRIRRTGRPFLTVLSFSGRGKWIYHILSKSACVPVRTR